MLDTRKVEHYLSITKQKKVLIRKGGRYYLAEMHTDPGNQYADPYDYLRIEEIAPPIELID